MSAQYMTLAPVVYLDAGVVREVKRAGVIITLDATQAAALAGSVAYVSTTTPFVDEPRMVVLGYDAFGSFPVIGDVDNLYVDLAAGVLYRWNGTTYVTAAEGAVPWTSITSKPAVIAAGATAADARAAIGASATGGLEQDANLAAFPGTGVATLVYAAQDTNKIYRWNGSSYVEMSSAAQGPRGYGITGAYLGTVANQAAMIAVVGAVGDWVIRSDTSTIWVVTALPSSLVGNWVQLEYPPVTVDATTMGGAISGAVAKTTPVDADLLAFADSAAGNIVKKVTWANAKTAMNVERKFWINAADYGCVGDDSTDNTATIAAAIAATASGGIVFFPVGIYRHTGITPPTAGKVILQGADEFATILKNTHATNPSVALDGVANPFAAGFGLRNLTLTATAKRTNQIGLHLTRASAYDIENVHIDTHGIGAQHDTSWSGSYRNLSIVGCDTGFSGPAGAASSPVTFYNCEVRSCTVGVELHNMSGMSWFGGTIQGCTTGLIVGTSNVTAFYGVVFEGNTGDDVVLGVDTEFNNVTSFHGCYFVTFAGKARSIHHRLNDAAFRDCLWYATGSGLTTAIVQDGTAGPLTLSHAVTSGATNMLSRVDGLYPPTYPTNLLSVGYGTLNQWPGPYDLSIEAFASISTRAVGTGDFPFGVKLQRAITITSVTFRALTADVSGNLIVELRDNGATISGTSTTIAAASQVAGGTSTGSWSVAAGHILTVYVTAVGITPGLGLIADIKASET